MASPEQVKKISLILNVDEEKNKVLYAEAGSGFVSILLSFLTLPLGTISAVIGKYFTVEPCTFNCISSLRQSVEDLDPKYFQSDEYKGRLLNPVNPLEADSVNLVYNFDDVQMSEGFWGYLDKPARFIVSDDLRVMPSDTKAVLWILQNFGTEFVPKRFDVNVTQKEICSYARSCTFRTLKYHRSLI
ncbi:uncharacterized protein LOC129290530 isoform X2 [Prosopis cineraria]|uniref:uncharacterized protein LOC129290530 isoform X2 n=1 Tax=Prosopis cineraria TaxID=364024 RepID=UPI0024107C4C|nr:uncharacterized protein LOC129290530 isoform X2 [Prosopis cineraria]